MPTIYRKYGNIIEITEFERQPSAVRISRSKGRSAVYGSRRRDNIARTRRVCVRRVLAALEDLGVPLLVTLTFRGDASDASFANDSLCRFVVRLRRKHPDAECIFVPELSPGGRIHFHGLVFGLPMHWGDTRKGGRTIAFGTERSERRIQRLWQQGFADVSKTDGSPRLAYYISKYIVKGAGEPIFGAMRLLRFSKGFPSETVIRGEMAERLRDRFRKRPHLSKWDKNMPYIGHIEKTFYPHDGDLSAN